LIQNLIANVNLREQKQTVGHVISQLSANLSSNCISIRVNGD